MKKTISVILILMMTLSLLPSIIFANEATTATITVEKTLDGTTENYEGDETFQFELTAKTTPAAASYIPMPNNKEATINDTYTFEITGIDKDSLTASIDLQFDFEGATVGKYEYDLKELARSNPSLHYSLAEYMIEIHIVNDENTDETKIGTTIVRLKDDDGNTTGDKLEKAEFTNIFKEYDLEINKTVTGLSGDKNKDFEFTVRIDETTSGKNSLSGTITEKDGTTKMINILTGDITDTNYIGTTFYLKHSEELVISGLPVKTYYSVVEENYESEGYATSYTVNSSAPVSEREYLDGEITDKKDTVAFVNTNGFTPPTGIILNTFIYGMITIIGVLGLGILFIINRRNKQTNS